MRQKLIKCCAVLLLIGGLTSLQAQETITTAGGSATGYRGSVAYTVGQVVYTTNFGLGSSLAQGVQQPYEISVNPWSGEAMGLTLQCSAYPNPVVDYLTLRIDSYVDENVNYTIYDVAGKLLVTQKVEKKITIISMMEFIPATYYLKVEQSMHATSPRKIKIFKIIQNEKL